MISKPVSFLIVEDSEDLCKGWEDILSIDGHLVKYFTTGHAALRAPQIYSQCDILVSDYYLPDINGIDLITKIRESRPNLPVILLTGSKDPAVRESIKKIPNALLLHKPLGIDELEHAVSRILSA
jgi:two-component system phosphoglycerate transport system response regulator PgtA